MSPVEDSPEDAQVEREQEEFDRDFNAAECEVVSDDENDVAPDEDMDEDDEADDSAAPLDTSLATLQGHSDAAICVKIRKDVALTTGQDDKLMFWDLREIDRIRPSSTSPTAPPAVVLQPQAICQDNTDTVVYADFNFDGSLVATAGYDGLVNVYNVGANSGSAAASASSSSVAPEKTFSGPSKEIEWLRWHPRGNVLIAGSADASMWMWNCRDESCMVFTGHSDSVQCGEFVCKGKLIATGSADKSVIVWNPKTGERVHTFNVASAVVSMSAKDEESGNSCLIVAGCEDGRSFVLHYDNEEKAGKQVKMLAGHDDSVEASVWLGTDDASCLDTTLGPMLVTASVDGKVRIHEVKSSYSMRKEIAPDGGPITCMKVLKGYIFATGSLDGTCKVWDGKNGNCLRVFEGHEDGVLSLDVTVISSNTVILATSSDDKTAKLWRYDFSKNA